MNYKAGAGIANVLTRYVAGTKAGEEQAREDERRKKADAATDVERKYRSKYLQDAASEIERKPWQQFAQRFDDPDWQRSTPAEQQQADLATYNQKAVELGMMPIDKIIDKVTPAMIDKAQALKASGYTEQQARAVMAPMYGPERTDSLFAGVLTGHATAAAAPSTLTPVGNLPAGPSLAVQPQATTPTDFAPANNILSQVIKAPPAAPPAPAPTEVATVPGGGVNPLAGAAMTGTEQPTDQTFGQALYAGGALGKDQQANLKVMLDQIAKGQYEIRAKTDPYGRSAQALAVSDWQAMYPHLPIPPSILAGTTATTANALKKPETDTRTYYNNARKLAMAGYFDQASWYADPILNKNEFPGLAAKPQMGMETALASMSNANDRMALSLARFAESQANHDEAAATRQAKDAAKNPLGLSPRAIALKLTGTARETAMKVGFSSDAVLTEPANVQRVMGDDKYWDYKSVRGVKNVKVLNDAGRKEISRINTKVRGGVVTKRTPTATTDHPTHTSKTPMADDAREIWAKRPHATVEEIAFVLTQIYGAGKHNYLSIAKTTKPRGK